MTSFQLPWLLNAFSLYCSQQTPWSIHIPSTTLSFSCFLVFLWKTDFLFTASLFPNRWIFSEEQHSSMWSSLSIHSWPLIIYLPLLSSCPMCLIFSLVNVLHFFFFTHLSYTCCSHWQHMSIHHWKKYIQFVNNFIKCILPGWWTLVHLCLPTYC